MSTTVTGAGRAKGSAGAGSGGGAVFGATVKENDVMSLTLSAARAAAQEFNSTLSTSTKDKEARRRIKKRRQKRREALEAAEAAAASAGVAFTGTMKKRAIKDLGGDDKGYGDEGFEADGDDAEAYGDDFEDGGDAVSVVPSPKGPSKPPLGGGSSNQNKTGTTRRRKSDEDYPLTDKMVPISIGMDAGFESTLGATKKPKKKTGRKDKSDSSFTDTYSRQGLPGRRFNDSDEEGAVFLVNGANGPRSLVDEALPTLHARTNSGRTGLSPRSSPGTSNYPSDSQLPTIGKKRK
jgi:hypothetical protein